MKRWLIVREEEAASKDAEGNHLDSFACLYIVRGEPYQPGACIHLDQDVTVIGRSGAVHSPDVGFSNVWISSRHLMISKENDTAFLTDMGSRNGTEINGVLIEPNKPYPLRSSDTITLAKGMTVFQFSYAFGEQTMELEPVSIPPHMPDKLAEHKIVDWEKRECIVNGSRIVMSEKEYLLLHLLHTNANHIVSIKEMMQAVWSDRCSGADGKPDVTLDELNALLYRIRKKYGKETFHIRAVRGSGYILEDES
ncbi:MAG: transcriptional regulator [Paenibacillus sp.]|nr:transcriptional regulator [Paenibacillus sp.]